MIRVLPDGLVNKIAAGEVVERPASVVKELVENAVDAGARQIDVTLRQGGKALIRVVDDGRGMGRQDALLCIERHATSKIADEDDLFAIATLGFRGEAVPSIASVSRFELTTRPPDEPVGTRLRLEGGKLVAVDDAGGPPGTCVDVRQLFFNLPARRKFLRADATELGHCVEVVMREALGRPDVAFAVRHEDRDLLRTTSVGDRAARVRELLGETGRALVPVAFEAEGISVVGLASPPEVHRGDAAGTAWLYVNGRFVRDAVVRRAVNDAYAGLVPRGRYPVVVLDLRLPPDRVDVNVHPAKTEVRFQDPFQLVRVVSTGLRDAVAPTAGAAPSVGGAPAEAPVPAEPLWHPPAPRAPLVPAAAPLGAPPPLIEARAVAEATLPWPAPAQDLMFYMRDGLSPQAAPEALANPAADAASLRPLGRWGPWLVCDGGPELVLVDARAAAIAAEVARLRAGPTAALGGAQQLAPPRRVELPAALAERVRAAADDLAALGIGVHPFGPNGFAVTSLPAALEAGDLGALLTGLVEATGADDRLWRLAERRVGDAPDDPGQWRRWLGAAGTGRVRVIRLRRDEIDRRGRG